MIKAEDQTPKVFEKPNDMVKVTCPTCFGSGTIRISAYHVKTCYACSGLGTVLVINLTGTELTIKP